jgi:hypothetical protein
MTRNHDPQFDTDEPHTTDEDHASFETEAGLVMYDPDNPDAWLEADTTIDPAEVA